MKITDLAFAVALSAMLLASAAAIGSVGLRTSPTDEAMPVFRLEPVVITGTKNSARAAGVKKAHLDEVATPCPRPPCTSGDSPPWMTVSRHAALADDRTV